MSKSIVSAITANVNVGIDEVCSVFVSQYEDNLFAKKKDLSAQIKSLKTDIKDLDARLVNSIDTAQYDITVPVLNLTSKVDDISVVWKGDKEDSYSSRNIKVSSIVVRIDVEDSDDTDRYKSSLTKSVNVTISAADEKTHNNLETELSDANGELVEVMGLIKSVSRKERQIRGRISAKKLEESGFEGLLTSPEMLKLVELD